MTERAYIEQLQQASRNTGHSQTDDDAAIITPSNVISTDQFVEGTHFLWSHMSAENLGYKAVVQALSDLAAMAARPTSVLCSLAWASEQHDQYLSGFIRGLEQACKDYSVPLVGGDITRSHGLFYCDIVVTGHTPKPIPKSGAKPGDIIAVTGTLGDARAGLESVGATALNALTTRYQTPIAYIDLALQLSAKYTLHALTDISDSLSKSLLSLARNSNVGMLIDDHSIPTSKALREYTTALNKNISDYKWNSGEDYQLLMSLPQEIAKQAILDFNLVAIGRVTPAPGVFVTANNKMEPLTEVGWDPFRL